MRKKGFTLIELLVVIAIIALLLSILIPSLAAIKEYATVVNCLSNQRSIAIAYIMYTGDNNDKFCSGYVYDDLNVRETPSWVKVPYLEDVKVFHCPGDKRLRKGAARYGTDSPPDPINVYQIYRSYGMPDFYRANADDDEKLLSSIKSGGSKLMFVEDQYDKWYNVDSWSYRPFTQTYWDPLGNYHNRSCTFAFVDGHAEHHKWRDPRTDVFMSDREAASAADYGKNDVQNNPINKDHNWLDSHYPYKTRLKSGN